MCAKRKETAMAGNRLGAFETMLEEVKSDMAFKQSEIEKLKLQGKEKSATFKQYVADKLFYQRVLSLYEKHDLL